MSKQAKIIKRVFKSELNEKGIIIGSFYVLNYCDICIFFRVCKTTKKSVYLIELATKKYKNGVMLVKDFKPAKNPYIVQNNNTWLNSLYEVFPTKDKLLPIEISYGSKLYNEALRRHKKPVVGTAYAEPIEEVWKWYWIIDDEIINGVA